MDADSCADVKDNWQMHEEVNHDKTARWDWRNESGSWFKRRGIAYLNERSVIFIVRCYAEGRLRRWKNVCPSVCLSHAGIVSKQLNTSTNFLTAE